MSFSYNHGRSANFGYSVPLIACFRLTKENDLIHQQTVSLPGNPLDVAIVDKDTAIAELIVAVDPHMLPDVSDSQHGSGPPFLVILQRDQKEGWMCSKTRLRTQNLLDGESSESLSEVQKTLYNIEHLRKTDSDDAPAVTGQ